MDSFIEAKLRALNKAEMDYYETMRSIQASCKHTERILTSTSSNKKEHRLCVTCGYEEAVNIGESYKFSLPSRPIEKLEHYRFILRRFKLSSGLIKYL